MQVGKLFKKLGIPIINKDGKDSVQEIIIKEHAGNFPIIKDYLEYKRYKKLTSTYGVDFLKYIDQRTGRIHSSFFQILNTGRTSSSSPNLQNIVQAKPDFPEGIWWREAFKAPEGSTFVIADYNSQELRVAAHKSGDATMINVLAANGDLHRVAAAGLYNKKEEDITSAERKEGKTMNFAIMYGAGADKVSKQFKVTTKAGELLLNNYFSKFPELKRLQQETYTSSITNGYILVDSLGRRSYIDGFDKYLELKKLVKDHNCPKELKKQFRIMDGNIFRDGSNYIIQGEAALISKQAGILLRRRAKDLFKIVLLIHDEWVIECKTSDQSEAKTILSECMEEAAAMYCKSLPIPAEALVSPKWNK